MILSRPRRLRRAHEWSAGKAVTFIVTLAATRCVTLAARAAGMSRKSAYALKARDPDFADAWQSAVSVRAALGQGDKADKVDKPSAPRAEGDNPARAAWSIPTTSGRPVEHRLADEARDRFFARLAVHLERAPSAEGLLLPREPLSIARQARSSGWQA